MDFIWATCVAIWGAVIVVQLLGIGRLLERISTEIVIVSRLLQKIEVDSHLFRSMDESNRLIDRHERNKEKHGE